MGRKRAAQPKPGPRPRPSEPRPAPAPPPPGWRDPWAWASLLAVLPALLRSAGTPLGEPFADDFLFLHRALLSSHFSWIDGGGAEVYWRPLSRQAYYLAFGRLMLAHPGAMAALHAALLAAAAWLFYRAFRTRLPGPLAAAIATFPLLAESARMLIAWPSHFQDLGALLFSALALHETARRRLPTALVAVLAAVLCKEVAAPLALVMPWMPDAPGAARPTPRRERLRWTGAFAAALAVWGAVYAAIHLRGGAAFARDVLPTTSMPLAVRAAWAIWNSLRAVVSLAYVRGPWDGPALLAAAGIAAAGVATLLIGSGRRRFAARWVLWGAAWFVAASATLTEVYPDWWTNRALPAMPGAGAALCVLADAAHPVALGGLVALRLATLAASPPAPPRIESAAPAGRGFDFVHLARLQRLVAATRRALREGCPRLARGSRVAWENLPHISTYAFEGNRALQLWYGDTTLAWIPASEFRAHPERMPATMVMYQSHREPQVVLVEPAAEAAYFRAEEQIAAARYEDALAWLRRADSLQTDRRAEVFLGGIVGDRGFVALRRGEFDRALLDERQSLVLWPQNVGAHVVIGNVELRRGNRLEARAQAESALALQRDDRDARALLDYLQSTEPRR